MMFTVCSVHLAREHIVFTLRGTISCCAVGVTAWFFTQTGEKTTTCWWLMGERSGGWQGRRGVSLRCPGAPAAAPPSEGAHRRCGFVTSSPRRGSGQTRRWGTAPLKPPPARGWPNDVANSARRSCVTLTPLNALLLVRKTMRMDDSERAVPMLGSSVFAVAAEVAAEVASRAPRVRRRFPDTWLWVESTVGYIRPTVWAQFCFTFRLISPE